MKHSSQIFGRRNGKGGRTLRRIVTTNMREQARKNAKQRKREAQSWL